MEITCTRCHQAIEEGSTYCAMCGLPQLVYEAETGAGPAQPDRRVESMRDAASIAWKPATSVAAKLAVPAGIVFAIFFLYSVVNQSDPLGVVFLMAATAAWAVAIYRRIQKPAWITIGAGARIGLLTGILSAWTFAGICGLLLYGARYWFNSGAFIDSSWTNTVNQLFANVSGASGFDPQTITLLKKVTLTPLGRAETFLSMTFELMTGLLIFAVAGGALGARFLARPRRRQV